MKKLKIIIFVDIIITLISLILMLVENKSSYFGLAALGSVGRFVIYMGLTIIGLIVLIVLFIIVYQRKKKMRNIGG